MFKACRTHALYIAGIPKQVVDFIPYTYGSIMAAGGKESHLITGREASDGVHVVIFWSMIMAVCERKRLLPGVRTVMDSMWSSSRLWSW